MPSKMTLFEMYCHDMLTSSEASSLQDVIINACDPMQNLDQTQIFYKAGQTWLTQAKRDLVDLDDPTQLQRWCECTTQARHVYTCNELKYMS